MKWPWEKPPTVVKQKTIEDLRESDPDFEKTVAKRVADFADSEMHMVLNEAQMAAVVAVLKDATIKRGGARTYYLSRKDYEAAIQRILDSGVGQDAPAERASESARVISIEEARQSKS